MLNYPSAERFFEHCLIEAGVIDGWQQRVSLGALRADAVACKTLIRSLRDIQTGADAVVARGKPAEDTLGLSTQEWEHRWVAWAASRRAAFFSRAAMLLLGEAEFFAYFIKTLKTSQNLAFLSSSNDVLQHATGYYLSGPEEDLSNPDLARWWQNRQEAGSLSFV